MFDGNKVHQVVSGQALQASWAEIILASEHFTFSTPTNMAGWGPNMTSKSGYLACLHPLLKRPDLFRDDGKRPLFMDLGCGVGFPILIAAQAGWRTIGIEVEPECCIVARENVAASLQRGEIEQDNLPIVLQGNYFPESFEVKRFPENSERDTRAHQGLAKAVDRVPRIDYQANNIDLGDVDIFYHFQWDNLDNLLGLFSLVGKPGALLCICGDGRSVDYRQRHLILAT
jgi:SAM-dependent methyltransferase